MKEVPWRGFTEVYKLLERQEHISVDDVINKVTQETVELLRAIEEWKNGEIYGEAWDVLINILSMSQELWFDLDQLLILQQWESADILNLTGKWNESVQAMRGRYTRKQWSLEEAEKLTKSFISTILNYTDPSMDMSDIVHGNLSKLMTRRNMYKPEINVKDYIAEYPDFPKDGINFKDISPILASPDAMQYVCHEMAEKCRWADKIVALDARGFLFAPMIQKILWIDVVMARKRGKLPGEAVSISYDLEYGSNTIEIQKWAINKWEKVAVVDDLLATGWTAMAVIKLIEKLGGVIHNAAFVIWLDEEFLLAGEARKQLNEYSHQAVVIYD
jgi:adenine phosphoribosyltransferase